MRRAPPEFFWQSTHPIPFDIAAALNVQESHNESRIARDTSDKAVNGGQTTISTSLTLANSIFRARTKSTPSATVLFIFQFPAIINLRSLFMIDLFLRQYRHAGQDLPLQQFQAGASTGAHESNFVAQFGQVQCLHTVTSPNDAFCAALLRDFGDGTRNRICPFSEPLVFE